MSSATHILASIAVLVLFLTAGCAINPVTGKADLVFMSENQEIKLGQQYHTQILKQYGKYDSPKLEAYISGLGNELAQVSHRNDLIFRFTVLDSPEVNAFALPGGYIYVTRGILAYLNSEAELAGVLGHEIGHVTHRHAVQRHAAGTVAGIFSTAVAIGTGSGAYADISQVFGGALLSGYGRTQELEADARGAEYIAKLGYQSDNMIDVITVLKDQELFAKAQAKSEGREPPAYHGLFATHPKNDTRLKEAITAAQQFRNKQQRPDRRMKYLQHIDGMVFGQSPKHGIIRNQVFYHPELNIAFGTPSGWLAKNLPDRVLFIAPQQAAIIQLTLENLHKKQTPAVYLKNKLGDTKVLKQSPLKLGKLNAYTITAESKTVFGKRPTRFTTAFKGDQAFTFTATVRNSNEFNHFDTTFKKIISSFHIMSVKEHDIAKPYRLKLHKPKPGQTYDALTKRSPIPNYAKQLLRLINGHYPSDEPKPGNTIKLIK